MPGVTNGGTDPTPSIEAYQYGAPRWVAGADKTPNMPVAAQATLGRRTIDVGGLTPLRLDVATSTGGPAPVTISYEVLDPSIVTVGEDGVVHGLAPGMTTVRVYATDRTGHRAVATATLAVQPASGSLPDGCSVNNYGTTMTAQPTAGFASYDDGTFHIEGDGANVWDSADRYTYLHRPFTGSDVTLTATVLDCTTKPAAGGLLIRGGDDAGSTMVNLRMQEGKACFVYRAGADKPASFYRENTPPVTLPVQLRLVKQRDTITATTTTDRAGEKWRRSTSP